MRNETQVWAKRTPGWSGLSHQHMKRDRPQQLVEMI